ncbi:MAG: tetratricopeptide repeat protein [Candidatus Omnitrophota bacterium]|nr:tetratricopeptide repeat protein [Candidatus Omnitrophota bacterium]
MQNPLVLEIFKQDKALKMSLFEQKELASTLRHYSQHAVSFGEINKLCQEITFTLNKANRNSVLDSAVFKNLVKTGQLLFDQLLTRPVKERLKSTHDIDLILFLDEELINIPWELLYDADNFLSLKFNLGRLVRTEKEALRIQYRASLNVPKMLILADPTNDLRSSYLEGVNIRNQFDRKRSNIHIDFKSTRIDKSYVKKNFSDYDIVHFAGHSEFQLNNLEKSGWLLSDGIFSIQEILAMGATVSLPALVFSNSCQVPALLQDEPLVLPDYQEKNYTLAAAFLFSGVRHYIGTIRKIEDKVSFTFARYFYTHLILGKTVGEAVRLSRLKLIKEYGITAVSWGSYLLYGDPGFVLFKPLFKKSVPGVKINLSRYKKHLTWVLAAIALVFLCVFLWVWLPTVNPSTYFLFLESKKFFLKGANRDTISYCSRIIKNEPLFLSAYPLLGDAYQRIGDKEDSLKYYFDYARVSEKRNDKNNLVSAYIGIGWIYHLQTEYSKAFDFYEKALSLSQETKNKLSEADVLGKLAVWYMDKKNNDKALELLTKSSEINRQRQHILRHRYNLACDYFNLGLLFTNKADLAAAKDFYEKSFDLFTRLKLKYELSDYYFNIGEIYSFQKEYQKALNCYMKGLDIDLAWGHKPNIAGDYNMIAELYVEMNNLSKAEEFFKQVVSVARSIDASSELANGYYNLAKLYKKLNRKNKVREYLRLAQEIYRKLDLERFQKIKEEFLVLNEEF